MGKNDIPIEYCPYCEQETPLEARSVIVKGRPPKSAELWYVECARCLARGPRQGSKRFAIMMWNHVAKIAGKHE